MEPSIAGLRQVTCVTCLLLLLLFPCCQGDRGVSDSAGRLRSNGVAAPDSQEELVFDPQVIFQQPFSPIENVPLMSAEQADLQLQPTDLVLGVSLQGTSRAYPISMLEGPSREIINDHLGDVPIAATW